MLREQLTWKSWSSIPNLSRRFRKTIGQYSLNLKWLGMFSLKQSYCGIKLRCMKRNPASCLPPPSSTRSRRSARKELPTPSSTDLLPRTACSPQKAWDRLRSSVSSHHLGALGLCHLLDPERSLQLLPRGRRGEKGRGHTEGRGDRRAKDVHGQEGNRGSHTCPQLLAD